MARAWAEVGTRAWASFVFALAVFQIMGAPRGAGWLWLGPVALWPSAGRRV